MKNYATSGVVKDQEYFGNCAWNRKIIDLPPRVTKVEKLAISTGLF